MKGIELSERFYLEYGEPMLRERFFDVMPFLAAGIAGSGSECLGFDDGVSRDHDFEAGFCIFIPDESIVDRKTEFALERAYSKLPKEFMGVKRDELSPVGGNRRGVIRIGDFLSQRTGRSDAKLELLEWFSIPEQSLAETVGGKIFYDGFGAITEARKRLEYFPEDVRRKKLAGELLIMGQAGQYNYSRCISREDAAAAQLAVFEFVKSALHVIFLLNKSYMPYYKWSFKALSLQKKLSELYSSLEYLISSDNSAARVKEKQRTIEEISQALTAELRIQGISDYSGGELEGHAYSVNSKIIDSQIRNLHVLYAV